MNSTVKNLREAMESYKSGKVATALELIKAVLKGEPDQLDALVLAGQIQHGTGNHEQAVFYLEKALLQVPGHVALSANTAASHLALGHAKTAESLARPAVLRQPDHFGARLNLGLALFAQRQYGSSVVELSKALELRPDSLVALKNLAHALQRSRQSHFKTRAMLEEVLARSPGDPETLAMLADSHIQTAETDQGLALFETLLGSVGDVPVIDSSRYHDSYLLALQYRQKTRPEDLYEASRQWADRYDLFPAEQPVQFSHNKLRIGWVSPRFADGPVACFLLPVLRAFDRSISEHYLYASRSHDGPTKDSFKQLSDTWRELEGLSIDEASDLLVKDELDILVDLAGHSPGGVLTMLCGRLATVQLSWLDSFCTTGVRNIDFFISDSYLSPPGSERYFTEQLLRLEPGRLCYQPQSSVAENSRKTDASDVVFASFNRLSKLGDNVLKAWSEILLALPGSRLHLRNSMFDDAEVRTAFYERFARFDLEQERVSLLGYCDYPEIMASYADVDIVLDPFPFSGCTTTCDALWMGVPVITQTGTTLVSRQSAAILNAIGLDKFVTESTQDYITSATKLARDKAMLSDLRSSLRKKMQTVFDPQVFAARMLHQFQQLIPGSGVPKS